MAKDIYVEMIVKGPEDQAKGFIEGLRIATPEVERVWFCCELPVESSSLIESIKERLHLSTHVVLPKPLAEMAAGALEESRVLELKVEHIAEVDYAELPFEYKGFSREIGASVRHLIEDDLPPGVRIEKYEVKELVDDNARGIELYSPAHDYTLIGSGVYVGPVEEIFDLAARLDDQDFVHPAKIKLHHVS